MLAHLFTPSHPVTVHACLPAIHAAGFGQLPLSPPAMFIPVCVCVGLQTDSSVGLAQCKTVHCSRNSLDVFSQGCSLVYALCGVSWSTVVLLLHSWRCMDSCSVTCPLQGLGVSVRVNCLILACICCPPLLSCCGTESINANPGSSSASMCAVLCGRVSCLQAGVLADGCCSQPVAWIYGSSTQHCACTLYACSPAAVACTMPCCIFVRVLLLGFCFTASVLLPQFV